MLKSLYPFLLLCLLSPAIMAQTSELELPLSRIDSAKILTNLALFDSLKATNDLRGATLAINEVAFTYWNNNHFSTAIKYYETSLELNERVANENGIAMIHGNLGMLYSDVGLYGIALEHFTKTLAARKANKETAGIISAQVNTSLVLNKLRRYDESIEMLDEALTLAKELKDLTQIRSVYGMLSETYEKKGDYENSILYFNLYRTFHEEVQRQEMKLVESELLEEKVARQEIAAENVQKENELLKQQVELLQKDQIIGTQDSINASLYDNLSRQALVTELLTKDTAMARLDLRAQQSENESLAAEKSYLQRLTFFTILTALIITSLVIIIVMKIRQHNKVLTLKNESISKQKEELNEANIMLQTSNDDLATALHELQLTKDKLILSAKMASLGAFTAGIAHEVNNSNNYVAGSAEMLCKIIEEEKEALKSSLSEEDLELIDDLRQTIKLGVNKTNTLFKNLRNSERFGASFFPIDLTQSIEQCLNVIQKKAKDKQIKFVKEYPDSVHLDANSDMVHQLLINLIDNAIDASPKNESITIGVAEVDENLHITISDKGTGIPQESLDKIYEPFFTTKQNGAGTGLGLYMAYGYVSKHRGNIDVQSDESGTNFTIVMPIHQEQDEYENMDSMKIMPIT